ncbi:MAG TPA: YncE family protein [Caldimonas sp.]|nr:YncE family protein [Caldimonas sp.]
MSISKALRHPRGAIGPALALFIAAYGSLAVAAPQVVATIALPDPVRWDYVSVDPAAHRLYIAHRERVDVIDTRDNSSVLQLAPTPGVHGAAAAADLGRVFTSNGADGTIGVFDAASGELLQTVKAGKNPDAIVYEPVTHRVFAFNGKSSDIAAIDARSLNVLADSIAVSGAPEYAVADGHGHVYFNVEDKSELAVLDARTLQIQRRYSLAPCEEPSGLAIDPKGRLYSVCQNGLMVISDPVQGRVIGQAPIGHGADGVAWLDGQAYSANGRDGTVSVVAETSEGRFETVATVATARGARTIAADPDEHVLFTPTADFKSLPTAALGKPGRPEAIPGTFRVLVLKHARVR